MESTGKLLLIAGILLAIVSSAEGQAKTGKINGIVTDITGAVVPAAKVIVTIGTTSVSLKTDADGEFHVSVPIGLARITVGGPGFQTAKIKRVRVASGASRSVKIILKAKEIKYGPCPGPDPCIWL